MPTHLLSKMRVLFHLGCPGETECSNLKVETGKVDLTKLVLPHLRLGQSCDTREKS